MLSEGLRVPDRILMGPGPSDVSPRVLGAMANTVLGHLDPSFLTIMDDTRELLKHVFETGNELTLPVPGTGGAGMETALCNFLEPGDKVVVGVAGFFSERIVEIAGRYGAQVHRVEQEWGRPLDPAAVEVAVRQVKPKLLAVVHAETSTGVRQPLEDLVAIADRHGALLLTDCVTSLGAMAIGVDRIGVDIAYSCSQKGLGCPPGLAPITVSPRADEVRRRRTAKVHCWYLDLSLLADYWGEARAYHHTAPINMIYALNEALRIVREEGLENRFARHLRLGRALQAGLEALGLELLVRDERYRLPMLTAVKIPAGVRDAEFRSTLLTDYGLEIGGGLGPLRGRVWRIGLMGESCKLRNVVTCLAAMEDLLERAGVELPPGAGVKRALETIKES